MQGGARAYPHLLQSLRVGPVVLKNRIMSTGHQTTLVEGNLPTDDFIAYHEERARGGVGLIVLEAHAVHPSGILTPHTIDAGNPAIVERHRRLAERVHAHGARVFVQLFHGGREAYVTDYRDPVVAPSAVPTERFHLIPRELEEEEIEDIVAGFVRAAVHLREAGVDGLEFVGSHGYLFTQFWGERTNIRSDRWGGGLEGRLRFAVETVRRVREAVGHAMALGMRISIGSEDDEGPGVEESLRVVEALEATGLLDYWSVVVGSSATYRGCAYIVPPAPVGAELALERARRVKARVARPVFVASRIYSPEQAERAIREGCADVVGMTRALIADPHLPRKIAGEEPGAVIPCIACNQGCIGRYQQHLPIRCTVNPVTGRERLYAELAPARVPLRVLVAGGGPAGMMAAIAAARRGHRVTLVEREPQLGGQLRVILGALHREQVGRWLEYLLGELEAAGVEVATSTPLDPASLPPGSVDAVVLATGARPRVPPLPADAGLPVLTAWDVLSGGAVPGQSVLVVDWKGDWPGVEAAELLAHRGHRVEIASATYHVGEALQQYVRNGFLARFDLMGVQMTPGFKLAAIRGGEVVLRNVFSGREEVRRPDAVVLALGADASESLRLYRALKGRVPRLYRVGDALAPRTLDEAVWEGFRIGAEL